MNLQVKRYDFNSGVASGARPSMLPSSDGEYCRYHDACVAIEIALAELTSKNLPATPNLIPRITCGQRIPLDKDGHANTYCMLLIGHEGRCK